MGMRRKNNSVGEKILPILSHLNVTDSQRLLSLQKQQVLADLNPGSSDRERVIISTLNLIFIHEYNSP